MKKQKFFENSYLFLALGLLIVVVGFTNSYFRRLNQLPFPYHPHGVSALLWLIIVVIQPYLYKIGKIKMHRWLGWMSLIPIPLIVFGNIGSHTRLAGLLIMVNPASISWIVEMFGYAFPGISIWWFLVSVFRKEGRQKQIRVLMIFLFLEFRMKKI